MDLQSPRPTTNPRRNPTRRAKNSAKAPDLINPPSAIADITPFPLNEILPLEPPEILLSAQKPAEQYTGPSSIADITPFPLNEILPLEPPQIFLSAQKPVEQDEGSGESLKVFLRIRPLEARNYPAAAGPRSRRKGASPKGGKSKKNNVCLLVNDSGSVTLSAPNSLLDSKRTKSEVYDGFSFVFPQDSLQTEIYERVMEPLVSDFMKGKSSLLAAMGPTGSGKTHTMFGCPREPGMVPLALQRIFCHANFNGNLHLSRSFFLSMFEIYSERGKGERIFDLLSDGVDLSLQQSTIKSSQEATISNVAEAESLIARGLLRRATAATNANNQSSRSQCIINIRSALESTDGVETSAVLTIADLAGSERERKTGNQGSRLLESSFINNTSMVFGLCLRSLLEHQKNPKKQHQKHSNNSLLTRYLKDYMEGKKRMTLILTVKPGEDDYPETSFLLRQASPYMKIKFSNNEEFHNASCRKRRTTSLIKLEHFKRKKYNDSETSLAHGGKSIDAVDELQISEKDVSSEKGQEIDAPECSNDIKHKEDNSVELQGTSRNDVIMQKFSRALWNVLKQFKQKLEKAENQVQSLTETLLLKTTQIIKLEEELKELRSDKSCKQDLKEFSISEVDACPCGAPLASVNGNNVKNADVAVDDSCFPASSESSLVTEDNPSVKDPGVEGILLDADLTGANQSTLNLLAKQSTSSIEGQKLVCQSSESSLVTEDNPSVKDPGVEGANQSALNLLAKQSTSSIEGQKKAENQVRSLTETLLLKTAQIIKLEEELKELRSDNSCKQDLKEFSISEVVACPCGAPFASVNGNNVKNADVAVDDSCFPVLVCQSSESSLVTEDNPSVKDPGVEGILLDADLAGANQSALNLLGKQSTSSIEGQKMSHIESVPQNIKSGVGNHPKKGKQDTIEVSNAEKPKRRLLPASSLLLRDFSGLGVEVENPKESKGKLTAEGGGRSQGTMELFQLLKGNQHR